MADPCGQVKKLLFPLELEHFLNVAEQLLFLSLGVASCCASIQLDLYDAVNRNKVSIRASPT
jgi:hypothetical protein